MWFHKIGKFEDFRGENYRKKVKKKKDREKRKEKIIVLYVLLKKSEIKKSSFV